MLNLLIQHQPAPVQHASPMREFLNAVALDEAWPERLIQDPSGHAFEPVQLMMAQEHRSLPERVAQLLRPEPVGGADPLIHANIARVQERARMRLHQRLTAAAETTQTRPFLEELHAEIRGVREQLETRSQAVDQAYTRVQETLRAWQQRMSQQSSRGLLRELAGWFLGESGQLSLPQAMTLWNEREHLALNRAAHKAAVSIVSQFLEDITYLLEHLETLSTQAQRLSVAAEQHIDALARRTEMYAPSTLRVDIVTVSDLLAQQIHADGLVVELLSRLATHGADDLAVAVQELARQEADRRLATLNIVRLMEVEASTVLQDGEDPLLLVGQALLETLNRRHTWQLISTAHPRVETLQVTPDGQPLYSLEGLSTAAYGESGHCLGFVQVQMDVAMNELRCLRDGADAFQTALQQRNFYVLEELAQAWEERAISNDIAPSRRTHPPKVVNAAPSTARPTLASTTMNDEDDADGQY
jgi:hypothetical protein